MCCRNRWRCGECSCTRRSDTRPIATATAAPHGVTGGAGTGKTVVAMHRAKALADRLDRPVGKPILFTTFSRNLAQAIEADLSSLGGSDLLDVVDVLNVDQLAYRVVQEEEGKAPSVADSKYCRT